MTQPPKARTSGRQRLFSLLRILLSLGLIGVLLYFVDVKQVGEALVNANPLLICVALLWLFLDRVVMAYRWDVLLRAKNIFVPLMELTKIYYIGSFWGLFLPSNLAPDAVRVYLAARTRSRQASEMFSSVFIDRFVGMAVLLGLAGLAVFMLVTLHQTALGFSTSTAVIVGSLSLPAIFWLWGKLPNPEALPFHVAGRFGEKLRQLYASCHAYRKERGLLVKVALLAVISHIGAILTVYVLSLALGFQVEILYFFLLVPLITVVTMLPVSLGGVGVQEGTFVYFFSLIGVPLSGALALSLLLRALSIVASLPGGFFSLSHDGNRLAET